MTVKDRIHQMVDHMTESEAGHVLSDLLKKEGSQKSLFETATAEEWEEFINGLAIDPSIPVLPDEALTREFIYED